MFPEGSPTHGRQPGAGFLPTLDDLEVPTRPPKSCNGGSEGPG